MAGIKNENRESKCKNCGSCVKDNILVFLVLIGAVSGFAIGFGVRPLEPSSDEVLWLGTASLDPKANGKIGTIAVVFVVSANIFGALMAVALFFIFNPGLIVVSSLIGMATARAGDVGVPFVTFFRSSSDILIILLKFTPIGVTSLIATSVSQIKELENTFRSLGLFVGTYTIGILVHHFLLVPVVWLIVMRTNPLRLLLTSFRPIITVFAPPSSAIGIPEVLNTCENKHGVDPRVSRFTVLFGATMSRMGSCYFICMSSLFIANLEGFELNAVRIILIVIVSSLGALALPAVPSASISLDIPARKVGILIALEWYTWLFISVFWV
ncbi:hypothetical protein KUTeg_022691 [Tegillarca granosa]|uniref:Amino acid transporter n=1 Tax=Tegillarca granosa TaxID=220873 RepID=A0ABQ9E4F7_TEGGR|nr:hypothetical protein KUTeg_022691 [Tegillarca granosa]